MLGGVKGKGRGGERCRELAVTSKSPVHPVRGRVSDQR